MSSADRATPNERFDPRDHEARRGKLRVSPVVAMVSIHVPTRARRRHIGSRRAAEIRSTRLGATQPVSSRRSRRRSTRPCERDFRPIGFPVSGRRFDLPAYEDAASRCSRRSRSTRPCGRDLRRIGFPASRRRLRSTCASRCSWPVRSTHQCGAREGAAPPRHSLASWRISSTCQCGRDVRRIGFASSPATVSIYVPMRVSPRPPRCDVVSCCLRPISLHAPMWARRQTY
jgi:hypothetical protein